MKSFLITIGLFCSALVSAQCPQADVIAKNRPKTKEKNPYEISSQSRSASLVPEGTYEMSFIAQNGMDYRITTKALKEGGGTISYEVYELVVEKQTTDGKIEYKRVKHVLASSDNATESLEFNTDKVRKIFVSISLSGGDKKKPVCVGVLVEDKRSTKIGF